jgi:predicted RNA-binding Zn-ribbon protein involved in translation (DUF1610 family)
MPQLAAQLECVNENTRLRDRKRLKDKTEKRLPVDKERWGMNDNTYTSPPDYYYDIEYKCSDCGKKEVWTAQQQKHWYEELGKTINSYAKRCQICRAHTNALKEDQKRHMVEMAKKEENPNKKFF